MILLEIIECRGPSVGDRVSGTECRGPSVGDRVSGTECRGPSVGDRVSGSALTHEIDGIFQNRVDDRTHDEKIGK
jgi:hypothetical protein